MFVSHTAGEGECCVFGGDMYTLLRDSEWDLDLGLDLDLDDVPDFITVDDILCCFQGYPNRPAQPTTPNAHAPDPAVSLFFLSPSCVLPLPKCFYTL